MSICPTFRATNVMYVVGVDYWKEVGVVKNKWVWFIKNTQFKAD